MKLPALLAALLLLSACQSPNPYLAESRPLPPAPPGAASTFDRSAYPAAPRDFGRYRSWAWQGGQLPAGNNWASPEEMADLVNSGLDQHGLRQARSPDQADLKVSASLRYERRLRQYDDYGGAYYGSGPWRDQYGAWATVPLVRTYEEQVAVVYLEFFDARDNQPVWSGSGEASAGGSRSDGVDALRDALNAALDDYPPY
ncbi:DUF4136 domain-containing protein [Metapseudomonas resinovorans]|uniref:DUF4136 domain-containing protein n=1 Tax=Metapseudomonas resinovorans NBRC 106553 TaxID=1245471 RepID=S6AJ68_METRE|nr:DUF4136 domain-containing protein [Pseudomonas resinovorans]BAN50792.1 hypothetical protein PCA10_50600 [Pseudomonas resinovorans NBRC 106553]